MKALLAIATIVLTVSGAVFFPHASHSQQAPPSSGFDVHEWGTFTTIAGPEGKAVQWTPLADATDLPKFVENLDTRSFKIGLAGKVRMETPVLYFYSPGERTVSVHVSFEKGLITEWYPHAMAAPLRPAQGAAFISKDTQGSLQWDSLHLEPSAGSGGFAAEPQASRYYAARETSATPIRVSSPQRDQAERFLFYRGVADIELPVAAKVTADNSVALQNLGGAEVPNMILFERRGDKAGYRVLGPLRDQGVFALPEPSATANGLQTDLEGILVAQGLYPDEAHAMLQTWKDSWFEEGARLFYIVPREFVDGVLPLAITPAPASITRVFVGRVELVTPQTERAVESAFATGDRATAIKYGRFLEPILTAMIEQSTDSQRKARLERYLEATYNGWLEPQDASR